MEEPLLLQNIRSVVPVSDADWQFINSLSEERVLRKGDFINREGEVNRFTNFIESGSARVFYIDNNGQEHVIQLGIRGWWVSDFASFITQKPGLLYAEALEPTKMVVFSYDDVQLIYEKIPLFERFYRLLIQKAYASFQYRILQNLSMDAEQRYLQFRESYPGIDAQLPQKHIASYLGMSAEFLSKIKKRLHQKRKKQSSTTSS
jgi:CRP-like cAMP-binding protein